MSAATGGSAFPSDTFFTNGEHNSHEDGMTLRDYFASKALPGLISAIMQDECHSWKSTDFASEAYSIADAMLLERAK